MKAFMKIIAKNIVSLAFAVTAGAIIFTDRTGWGWFLFAAIVTNESVTFQNPNKTEK